MAVACRAIAGETEQGDERTRNRLIISYPLGRESERAFASFGMHPFPMRLLPVLLCLAVPLCAAEPKPVPRMQVIPLPHEEASFQRDGEEIARFHFAQDQKRPFVFPVIGPSGRRDGMDARRLRLSIRGRA